MYPWFWLWAPLFQFPFGSFYQDIEPKTDWFTNTIKPEAGDADMEKKIVDIASYGKQLGLIMEVLLSMQEGTTFDQKKAAESLQRLQKLSTDIDKAKKKNTVEKADKIIELMNKLQDSDKTQFQRVLQRFTGNA